MPSAVSTSVNERPVDREIVCAPLEYEPFAIAIRATPFVTATSRKSGFALGNVAPTRTSWIRPLTEIRAVPVAASVRTCFVCVPFEALLLEPPDEAGTLALAVCTGVVALLTCCTNGSLPEKWVKARSVDFDRAGCTSEFGSFVLAVGVTAAAAVPGAVTGTPVAGTPVAVVSVGVVAAGGAAVELPLCMTLGTS